MTDVSFRKCVILVCLAVVCSWAFGRDLNQVSTHTLTVLGEIPIQESPLCNPLGLSDMVTTSLFVIGSALF